MHYMTVISLDKSDEPKNIRKRAVSLLIIGFDTALLSLCVHNL